MNNGNLLNSLLGMSNANPAVTKATAAKARAESTEKFQQALEQARPEVAARKPAPRKESAVKERTASEPRPAPQPAVQRPAQQESGRAEARPAPANNQNVTSKAADQAESSAQDTAVKEPVATAQNEAPSTDAQKQAVASGEEKTEGQQDLEAAQFAIESLLVVDPTMVKTDQSGQSLALVDSADKKDGELELVNPEDVVDSSVLLQTPDLLAVTSPPTSLAPASSIDTVGDDLSPLLVNNQPVLGQLTPGQAVAAQVDGQSLAIQIAGGSLTGKPIDGQIPDLTLDGAVAESSAGSETLTDTNTDENPDFLLLNSKAAQNKLAETTLTAANFDKPAPATELAKPTVVNAAVETLTRLSEAQSPAARAFVVQTGVPVTVGTPQWSQAVGDKVLWLAAQNVSSAEIRLDPPELGPMQVKVSVNQDQASITFTSPHPAVREALDQQLNRLREMFSEQGLNLVNVDVSDKSFAQREREQEESAKNQANTELNEEELAPVAITQAISMRLVDHYA